MEEENKLLIMSRYFSTIILLLFLLVAKAQTIPSDFPVVKAKSAEADYRIGNDLIKGEWTILPQIPSDTLLLFCNLEGERFSFITDLDSITILLHPGEIHKFYVNLNDTAKALTVIKAVNSDDLVTLEFYSKPSKGNYKFQYEDYKKSNYLTKLRSDSPLDSLIKDAVSDTEKALKIMNWVHHQWNHNGKNKPKRNDAISILEEAKSGKSFRCVEYGIVTAACLNAIGLKSRVIYLKTKNVETTPSGAGHVLTEVYMYDLKKWVLLDGQWNTMPVLNGIPLNAVEFQKAISENYEKLEIRSLSITGKRKYVSWIYPYLYYFDVPFDNRSRQNQNINKAQMKSNLMLVPLGAKNPEIFQINNRMDYLIYTSSYSDFYSSPE